MTQTSDQRAPYRRRNVGKLLTRLQPKSLPLMPRKGSSGYREPWDIEDGVTIAGALGAVAARGPGPAFAVTVLCLRWWPDYVLGPEVVHVHSQPTESATPAPRGKGPRKVGSKVGARSLLQDVPLKLGYGRSERLVREKVEAGEKGKGKPVMVKRAVESVSRHLTFRPALQPLLHFANRGFEKHIRWETVPESAAQALRAALAEGRMVATLLDEYVNPNFCPTCHGYGQVLAQRDADGRHAANPIAECPDCIGSGHQPWGVARRAKSIGIRLETFHKHGAGAYAAVLGLFRGLEGRAARALVRALGD